jgi:hypothetical protein
MGPFLGALRASRDLRLRIAIAVALLAAIAMPMLAYAHARTPAPIPGVYDADSDDAVARVAFTSGATTPSAGHAAIDPLLVGPVAHRDDWPACDRAVCSARPRSPPAS